MSKTKRPPAGWEFRSIDGVRRLMPKHDDLDGVQFRPVIQRAARAVEGADNAIEIIGSTEAVDSYGTVFIQRGMQDARFKMNPVFLRQHEANDLPLGLADSWRRETIKVRIRGQRNLREVDATFFRIIFDVADDPADDDPYQMLSRAYLDRYRRGTLRGASIGFQIPDMEWVSWGDEMSEEERGRWGLDEYGILFRKWELVELSAVSVPSNPYALARSLSCSTRDLEALTLRVNDLEARLATVAQARTPDTDPVEPSGEPEEGNSEIEPGVTESRESDDDPTPDQWRRFADALRTP